LYEIDNVAYNAGMKLGLRYYPVIPACLAASALGVALISQYGFDKHPCELCITQRIPYVVVIVVACLMRLCRKQARFQRVLWVIVIGGFLATAGVGAYHAMVELGWVAGPDSCSAAKGTTDSLEAMKAQIMGAALVSCSNVSVAFLGVSMAAWNTLYAAGCALVSIYLTRTQGKTHHEAI
jgi:disulfide bond formation protein DsbB